MSRWFEGDDNALLMKVQVDTTSSLIGYLFEYPASRYLNALYIIGEQTDLGNKIREHLYRKQDQYFTRYLHSIYDYICAHYRFFVLTPGTLPFIEKTTEYENQTKNWIDYYRSFVQDICSDNTLSLNLIKAVVYYDYEAGVKAEQDALDHIKEKYGLG
jgi:hypothetical protein